MKILKLCKLSVTILGVCWQTSFRGRRLLVQTLLEQPGLLGQTLPGQAALLGQTLLGQKILLE